MRQLVCPSWDFGISQYKLFVPHKVSVSFFMRRRCRHRMRPVLEDCCLNKVTGGCILPSNLHNAVIPAGIPGPPERHRTGKAV